MSATNAFIRTSTVIANPGVSGRNFGIVLLLVPLTAGQDALWDQFYPPGEDGVVTPTVPVDRSSWTTFARNLSLDDGDPIRKELTALFGQSRTPTRVIVGRRSPAAPEEELITVDTAAAGTYTVTIDGTDHTYTASGTDDVDAIALGLQGAIESGRGAPGGEVVALATGALVQVLARSPGDTFALTLGGDNAANMSQVNTPEVPASRTSATQGIIDAGIDFFFVIESAYPDDITIAIDYAQYLSTQKRMYLYRSTDEQVLVDASSTDDWSRLSALNLEFVGPFYTSGQRNVEQSSTAAAVAIWSSYEPGTLTWVHHRVAGILGEPITEGQYPTLIRKRGNWVNFDRVTNVTQTLGGLVSSGEFGDNIRLREAINDRIKTRVLALLLIVPKLPFTEQGLQTLAAAVSGSVAEFGSNDDRPGGVIGSSIDVTVTDVEDISDADKLTRIVRGVRWSAKLAGAIHETVIEGTLIP